MNFSASYLFVNSVLSRDEQEEEEMKKMPKFKAREIDPLVMQSSGDIGVPRVSKPAVTEFHEFHLATQDRAASKPAATPAKQHTAAFKARPVPETIYSAGKIICLLSL